MHLLWDSFIFFLVFFCLFFKLDVQEWGWVSCEWDSNGNIWWNFLNAIPEGFYFHFVLIMVLRMESMLKEVTLSF